MAPAGTVGGPLAAAGAASARQKASAATPAARTSTDSLNHAIRKMVAMGERPSRGPIYQVVCPHCGKSFEAELNSCSAARYQGFKCPQCKLFVSYERVDGDVAPVAPPHPA